MRQFQIRAIDNAGSLHELSLAVARPTQLSEELARRGLRPLTIKGGGAWRISRFLSGESFDVQLFVHELTSLLKAGLSVPEAVDLLAEKAGSTPQGQVLIRLSGYLHQGDRLSRALERESPLFPPLLIAMTQASESAAGLNAGFERYLRYDNAARQMRRKVTGALIYPALLLSVAAAVTLFLVTFVVPRFAQLLDEGTREIPTITAGLLYISTALREHWIGCVLASSALIVSAIYSWRRRGAAWIGKRVEAIPIVGARVHAARVSRLLMALAALLDAGIPLREALELARSVLPSASVDRIQIVRSSLEQGLPLSHALHGAGLSTLVSERLLRVGERSGDLAGLCAQAARHHEEEIERFLERFMRVAEPVLMAAIGLVIGAVVIALYMPLFDLAQWVQ
jgi:general secretion pathway protein F